MINHNRMVINIPIVDTQYTKTEIKSPALSFSTLVNVLSVSVTMTLNVCAPLENDDEIHFRLVSVQTSKSIEKCTLKHITWIYITHCWRGMPKRIATTQSTGAFVDHPPHAMVHHILKMKNLMRNMKLNYNFVNDDSKLLVSEHELKFVHLFVIFVYSTILYYIIGKHIYSYSMDGWLYKYTYMFVYLHGTYPSHSLSVISFFVARWSSCFFFVWWFGEVAFNPECTNRERSCHLYSCMHTENAPPFRHSQTASTQPMYI